MLAVGDTTNFDGAAGTVVGITDTLDSNGRGSITYAGSTFRFRVLKCSNYSSTEYPLSTGGADPYLRVGLVLRDDSSPALYCLWFDDLPAPLGWGAWVKGIGGTWAEASSLSGQDALTMIVGRRYGPLTLQRGGAAAASGAYCDLVLYYQTPQGEARAWYQPAYPYNGLLVNPVSGVVLRDSTTDLGMFVVSGSAGRVYYRHPDGTLEDQIILPTGIGALGNTGTDRWVSGPEPSRYLTKVEAWFLQEHVELEPETAVTLNAQACQITVTGPANSRAVLEWEGGGRFPISEEGGTYYDLGAGGSYTVTGLPTGKYIVSLWHPSDLSKGIGKRNVTVAEPGDTATCAFGTSWTSTPGGMGGWGWVYAYDDVPCAGAEIWSYMPPGLGLPPEWVLLATADANGYFEVAGYGSDLTIAYHPTYGAAAFDMSGAKAVQFWDPRLSTRVGSGRVASSEVFSEGIIPWGYAGEHVNLPSHFKFGYLQNPTTGQKYWFHPGSQGNGSVTDPFPMWMPSGGPGGWTSDPIPASGISYDVFDADGTDTGSNVGGHEDSDAPYWADTPWYQSEYEGSHLSMILGGKYEGPVVEYRTSELTEGVLREPERNGLETGRWVQPLDHVSHSETVRIAAEAENRTYYRGLTFCTFECPYCGGPVAGFRALGLGYTRGECQQCADYSIVTDSRSYLLTQTLSALGDWQDTTGKQTTRGGYVQRLIAGWPRPEEYAETNDYLVDNWNSLGVPRWVATHLVLGYLVGGTFTDGESIAQAESRLGRTVGPVQLKFLLLHDYTGIGCQVEVTATRWDGISVVLRGTLTTGMKAGEFVLLKPCPHSDYPTDSWFVDVTNITQFGSPGMGYVAGQVVNDGPAWHSSSGVQITSGAYSPFACDVMLGGREPYLVTEATGLLHCVYLRDGQVMHALKQYGKPFADIYSVTARAGWYQSCQRPCIARLYRGGGLLVSATSAGVTKLWYSATNGDSWTSLPDLGLTLVEFLVRPREGFLDLVGLSGSTLTYGLSDTNGQTWSLSTVYEGVDSQVPPTLTVQNGRVYVQARVAGDTKTWFYDGSQWRFAGS